MKQWKALAVAAVAGMAVAAAAYAATGPNILTTLSSTQLVRIFNAGSPGSTQGWTTLSTLANSGILVGPYPTATTGAGTQTFTNSPCTGLTTEEWVPVSIKGQTGTWFVAACQ